MTEFSVEEALARLRADGRDGGRKLSFAEKCGAFAALYGGAKNMFVARAFNLSLTSTSYLNGCLKYDPNPVRPQLVYRDGAMVEEPLDRDHNRGRNPNRRQRYEDVAREFEALGEAEFNRRYLTKEIYNRIAQARREMIAERGRVAIG